MNQKVLIIHNPRAGQKKKINLKESLKSWNSGSTPYDYVETEYGGHATILTEKAVQDKYSCVVAAGGDGTVNEIATALVDTDTALGIIPMGSGNGLARHNQIPLNLEKAFKTIYNGEEKPIDAGSINGKNFFCAAGIGFDALVSEKFAESKTRGLISYFTIALEQYLTYNSRIYKLLIKDKTMERKSFFITFANANQFGNHAYIAPQAKIDDGLLEVCILQPFKWYQSFLLAYQLFNKKITSSGLYESFETGELTITSEKNIPFHYDGEIMKNESDQVKVNIKSKALKIIIPSSK